MEKKIYVQLLGEGTRVYRPVPAVQITPTIYELGGDDFHNPEDEEWEFLPRSRVYVKKMILSDEDVLVAFARALE